MVDLTEITEKDLINHYDVVVKTLEISIFNLTQERDKINKELRKVRKYLKKIRGR